MTVGILGWGDGGLVFVKLALIEDEVCWEFDGNPSSSKMNEIT